MEGDIREFLNGLFEDLPDSRDPISEPWNTTTALALMAATDGTIERLGVRGTDPGIQAAAASYVEAHARRDMAGIRRACDEIERLARELTTRPTPHFSKQPTGEHQ